MSNCNKLSKSQERRLNIQNDHGTREAYEKLVDKFHGDQHRANDFMHTPNQELGGRSPLSMVGDHRTAELNGFIDKNRKRYY